MDPQAPNIPVPEFPKVEDPERVVSEIKPRVERDNHWISILAMAIFVVLTLGVVAFLYYQNQALKSMLASQSTNQQINQSPSPSPTADPTADWKTYTGKSFTFKYPANFFIGDETAPLKVCNDFQPSQVCISDVGNWPSGVVEPLINQLDISVTDNAQNLSVDSYLKNTFGASSPLLQSLVSGETTVSISGIQSVKLPGYGTPGNQYEIYVPYKNKMFSFSVAAADTTDTGKSFLTTINKILSTFKFTEATPSASPISSATPSGF